MLASLAGTDFLEMKNLKVSLELSSELELQLEGEALLLSVFDVQQRRLFFASSANFIYAVHLASSHVSGRSFFTVAFL